ncbi:hypothetical protein Q5752_003215 [Cryptotrichosporon argae]
MPALPGPISRLLHSLVFSFPSPSNASAPSPFAPDTEAAPSADAPAAPHAARSFATVSGSSLLTEPGETRALASGVGPLSFMGSGYGVTLVVMAILLNRIHHIVQRARPPPPPLPHPPTTVYRRFLRLVSIALTSSSTPRFFRLPGLAFLVRAWTLLSALTLQVAGLWPADDARLERSLTGRAVARIGHWAGEMEMQSACWTVFVSVCVGLVCGALANGLDRGRRRDVGASFNLFGYSFLLHLYSSPLTHHVPPPAAHHGRPDIHALFQLWLSLTELTWLQAIELSPGLRRNQLLPTGVCGTMGLVHFVYALFHSPLRFPSFTFITHLVALALVLVTSTTVVLKAFTHIFTVGHIPSPVWASVLPHAGAAPSIEDDFGVALLKLGSACIETTNFSGLRNELAPIEERAAPVVELSVAGSVTRHTGRGGFGARIDTVHTANLEDPYAESPYWKEAKHFRAALTRLIKDVAWLAVVGTPGGLRLYLAARRRIRGRWWYGPRTWRVWQAAAWAGPLRPVEETRLVPVRRIRRLPVVPVVPVERVGSPEPDADAQITFGQLVRGEVALPGGWEDDGEWEDESEGSDGESASEGESEAGELYKEFVTPVRRRPRRSPSAGPAWAATKADDGRAAGPEDDADEDVAADASIQPILLAHLTAPSPLTRRAYRALTQSASGGGGGDDVWADVVRRRRTVAADAHGHGHARPESDAWDDERRRTCVVCMVSPRDVLLWPCRCLLMCNDCRDSLAARLAADAHMCPSCRTKVEGYSRIYVP